MKLSRGSEGYDFSTRHWYFRALGVLDASECPPTFGVSPEMVQGVIAEVTTRAIARLKLQRTMLMPVALI